MKDRAALDQRTRHFGTVTASLSHELGNVLATVQEAAGLMDDYVSGGNEAEMIEAACLEPVLGRIDRSVTRGLDLVRHLNWIAHSIDPTQSRPDLLEVIERAATSARYFARQRCVELQVAPAASPGPVRMSAMDLHILLFSCFRFAAAGAPEGATVTCEPAGAEQGPSVSFQVSDGDLSQTPREELVALAAAAGVRLEFRPGPPGAGALSLFLSDADGTDQGADESEVRRLP